MAKSNVDEIAAILADLAHCTELDRPGPNGEPTLADAVFDVDVRGIRDRSVAGQHGPAGEAWPPNEPRYARRKGGKPIGVLTGEMLGERELAGTRLVGADHAEMHYGVGGFAQSKARWFEEGTSRQPERPFYAASEENDAEKSAIVEQQIQRAVERLGG